MGGFDLIWRAVQDTWAALGSSDTHVVGVWIIALVLTWSGTAKVRHPVEAAGALLDFGVSSRLRPGLGAALGWGELAVAALVVLSLPAGAAPHAAALAVATALFGAFTVLLARSLRNGRQFPCRCFGSDDAPLSRFTLVRAGMLAVLAGLLLAGALGLAPAADDAPLALAGVVAAALVMGVALLATLPRLLRWNDDPFDLADRQNVRRSAP